MKLGLIAPHPQDSTSFYRSFGVLGPIERDTDISLLTGDKWSWDMLVRCDVLFMQRPWVEAHVQVAATAKQMGIPLVLDYDDNLFALQRSNPAYSVFMNSQAQQNMMKLAELADVVTVTTPHLANLPPYKGKAIVVPNAMNDCYWEHSTVPRKNLISWRGGISHYGDMDGHLSSIGRVADSHPDWKWLFIGDPHWGIEHAIPVSHRSNAPFTSIFNYMEGFAKAAPAIHIVPLANNAFNHSKSNLAWIEATVAGAVVVAPDWMEWHRPGIINYGDGDFERVLTAAIAEKPEVRQQRVDLSRDYINKNLRLSGVNEQRIEILRKLHNHEPLFA